MLQTTGQEKLLGSYEIKFIEFPVGDKTYKYPAPMNYVQIILQWAYLYDKNNIELI
jgi:hypothetical protein